MTPTKRKMLHAALVALATAVTDVGVQLGTIGAVDLTRSAVAGLVVGIFARVLGAVLAYTAAVAE